MGDLLERTPADIFTADLARLDGPGKRAAFLDGVAAVIAEADQEGYVPARSMPLGWLLDHLASDSPLATASRGPEDFSPLLAKVRFLNDLYGGLEPGIGTIRHAGVNGMEVRIGDDSSVDIR